MSSEIDLLDRVRAALADIPDVTEKRMFGGVGFLVRGHLCVSCRPQRIMCRIDPAIHDEVIRQDGCRTMVMGGREYRGYVHVDAESVRTQRSLKRWIDLALSYNESLPSKKAK